MNSESVLCWYFSQLLSDRFLWIFTDFASTSGAKAKNVITSAREQTAEGIGAVPSDIVFTSGGTEANNWVISSTIEHFKQYGPAESKIKPHIISTTIEHDAISLPLIHFRDKGEIGW